MAFSYVYLLVNEANPSHHCVGLTGDIKHSTVPAGGDMRK